MGSRRGFANMALNVSALRLLSILLLLFCIGSSVGKSQCPAISCEKSKICATDRKAVSPAPTLSVLSDSRAAHTTFTVSASSLPTTGFDSHDFFAPSSKSENKRALQDPVPDANVYVESLYGRMGNDQLVPLDDDEFTSTARYWYWNTLPGQTAAGIMGLCGCTSVIVLSDMAVYVSHIWDGWFGDECDSQEAVSDIMDTLWNGNPLDNSPGLRGLTQPGGPFSAQYHPVTFILSPREDDNSELNYPEEIGILRQHLARAIPSRMSPQTIPYTADLDIGLGVDNVNGRAAVEYDSRQSMVMFNGSPTPTGMWRLWVQNREIARHQFVYPSNAS